MADIPERDLFLLKELDEETSGKLIEEIIKVNIYDAEQECKVVGYERKPIRLHICTPRRNVKLWFCNM